MLIQLPEISSLHTNERTLMLNFKKTVLKRRSMDRAQSKTQLRKEPQSNIKIEETNTYQKLKSSKVLRKHISNNMSYLRNKLNDQLIFRDI